MAPVGGGSGGGGVPTYRFSSVVKGAAVPESEYLRCRCTLVENFYVPAGARADGGAPVLLCRSVSYERRGGAPLAEAHRTAFLLYSGRLAPGVKRIDLLLGRSAYEGFLAAHADPPPPPPARSLEYDGFRVAHSPTPFRSLLQHRGGAEGRQLLGYELTSTSPTGFTSVGVSGFPPSGGVSGGTVFWTSGTQTAPSPAKAPEAEGPHPKE